MMYEYDVELEQALYAALARVPAPDDLIARVEARLLHTALPVVSVPTFSLLNLGASSGWTRLLSAGVHTAAVAAIVLLLFEGRHMVSPPQRNLGAVDVRPFMPMTAKLDQAMGGGGGGGAHNPVEASKGHLPEIAKAQITPPQLLQVDKPKLAVQSTVVMPQAIKLPDTNLPNIGVPQSPQVALGSQGVGANSGFGDGIGGGIGSGKGNGIGPGEGGGYGGGVMRPGGGVSAPVLIYSVDPEFSDEARRAKYQGICVVELVVDATGSPQDVHVVRSLGMGLDEKAVEAVKQYRFKPSYFQGHPVPVRINVEVNFRIY